MESKFKAKVGDKVKKTKGMWGERSELSHE
jgi:hypothetical protein